MNWIIPTSFLLIAGGIIYAIIRMAMHEQEKLKRIGKKRKDDLYGKIKTY